jgi:hypothetical protein
MDCIADSNESIPAVLCRDNWMAIALLLLTNFLCGSMRPDHVLGALLQSLVY